MSLAGAASAKKDVFAAMGLGSGTRDGGLYVARVVRKELRCEHMHDIRRVPCQQAINALNFSIAGGRRD